MNATRSSSPTPFNVVVIGGGITGLAVARASARAGHHTLLIDKATFGSKTSSNSLRIIHGGFRYLQSLDFARVLLSIKDQSRVEKEFTDLVRILPCYLALERFSLKSSLPLTAASIIYSMLGSVIGAKRPAPYIVSKANAEQRLPLLNGRVPHGAFVWHDLQLINPEALHQRIAEQISEAGGVLAEHQQVTEIKRLGELFQVTVKTDQGIKNYLSKVIVNTLGPWIEEVTLTEAQEQLPSNLSWCRAFNLVYQGNPYGTFGAGIPSSDGRLLFIVGRDNQIAVGTEYKSARGGADQAQIGEGEIEEFHKLISNALPELSLTRNKLQSVESGVLPTDSRARTYERGLYGSAAIKANDRYISILSTKYTTFLSQADKALRLIEQELA